MKVSHPLRALVPMLVTTILAASVSSAQATPWRKGEPLPDLRLPTIDGERTVSLSDFRGKKLLLVEFASW